MIASFLIGNIIHTTNLERMLWLFCGPSLFCFPALFLVDRILIYAGRLADPIEHRLSLLARSRFALAGVRDRAEVAFWRAYERFTSDAPRCDDCICLAGSFCKCRCHGHKGGAR